MEILLHRNFKKKFKKLSPKIKRIYFEKVGVFINDPFHPSLHNHSVAPQYPGWRSIDITGDFRVLFEPKKENLVLFMKIGTHSELYK